MILSESNLAVREKLAKYSNTNPDDWFLCLKARYGMAASFTTNPLNHPRRQTRKQAYSRNRRPAYSRYHQSRNPKHR